MAYMSQERKAKMAPKIKAVLAKYGMKGSIAVDNHSTLVVNVKSGKLDLIGNSNETCAADRYQVAHGFVPDKDYMQVNPYHFNKHFSGDSLAFMTELLEAMNEGNHNNSDIMTNYFDVGWYVDVNVGKWDKPYIVTN